MKRWISVVFAGGVLALTLSVGANAATALTFSAGANAAATALTGTVGANAATFEDGQAAYDRGDYAAALKVWGPLAEHGDGRSQNMVGLAYRLGRGVRQDDLMAVAWYRRAAEQGVTEAEENLGSMYADGLGVSLDYAQAIKWWRKAAD